MKSSWKNLGLLSVFVVCFARCETGDKKGSSEGDAGLHSDTDTNIDSDTDSDSVTDTQAPSTDTDSELNSDADSEAESDTDSSADTTNSDADSEMDADTDTDSNSDADTDADGGTNTDSDSSDTDASTDTFADSEKGSNSDADMEPDGGPDAGPETDDECLSELKVIYYDFEPDHPDFGCSMAGSSITPGLVLDTLDADRKPQYNPDSPPSPSGNSDPMITSAETFFEWFHEVPGTNVVTEGVLDLFEDPPGSGIFKYENEDHVIIPGTGAFTTEIHSEFVYEKGQVFTFSGDDDVWVFIDNRLAVDVGGLHSEETGTVNLDELGLTPGEKYTIDMFHAERCYPVSVFKLETSIKCFNDIIVI